MAHSSSEQPRAHGLICRRLTLLTRISVRLGQCLGFHVGSKSEATTARPTSWAQAEGHRPTAFLVNPKHSLTTPATFYCHLPINNIALANPDVGSPLTSTVTSSETSALHCATLPHTNPACIARIPCASRALPPPRRSRTLHHRPRRPSPADSLAKPALVSVFFIEAQGAMMRSGRWLCSPLFFHPSCAVVPTTVRYNPYSREGRRSLQLIALPVSLSPCTRDFWSHTSPHFLPLLLNFLVWGHLAVCAPDRPCYTVPITIDVQANMLSLSRWCRSCFP